MSIKIASRALEYDVQSSNLIYCICMTVLAFDLEKYSMMQFTLVP